MSDPNEYALNTIKTWVWSGFYGQDEVQEMIDDILEEDADEDLVRGAVAPEFDKKAAAERSWPKVTDCDRLDQAFAALNTSGIIALHNTGMTMSDGISDVAEVLHHRGRDKIRGYCFYHGQDLERAVDGAGLTLAFGDINDDSAVKTQIGQEVNAVLKSHGFKTEWNGDPEARIEIPSIDWKRRL